MKQYLVIIAALACGAIVVGCFDDNSLSGSEKETTEANIEEAVYRYQINQLAALEPHAFYLELRRKDPPDSFMDRFLGDKPEVKKVSESTFGEGGQVMDRTSGKPGVLLHIDRISSATAKKASVDGGYVANDRTSSSDIFILENRDGEWIVTEDTVL